MKTSMVMIIYSSLERGTLRKTAKTLARTAEADHIGCCSPENPPDHFKEIHRMARKQAPDMPFLPGFETAVRDAALAAARDRKALLDVRTRHGAQPDYDDLIEGRLG